MICTLTNYDENNDKCKQCDWQEDCKNDKPIPDEFRDKIAFAAKLWLEAKELEQIANDKLASAKGIFITVIKDTSVNQFRVENLSISYKGQERKSYDTKVLEALFSPEKLMPALKISKFNVLRVRDLSTNGE